MIQTDEKKEVQRLVVELEIDLFHKAKIKAAEERITLKQLVSIALNDYIIRRKKKG